MCLVSAAGKGGDPRREEGDRKQKSPHGVHQGTEQLLPLASTFAGLAFTPCTIIFPLNSSIISLRSCVLAGACEPFLGRKLVVTGELSHMLTEQKRALSVLCGIEPGLRLRCCGDRCFAV